MVLVEGAEHEVEVKTKQFSDVQLRGGSSLRHCSVVQAAALISQRQASGFYRQALRNSWSLPGFPASSGDGSVAADVQYRWVPEHWQPWSSMTELKELL